MKFALYLLLLPLFTSHLFADQTLGLTSIEVAAGDAERPLKLSLWYPALSGNEQTVGGNAVFAGETAVTNAAIVAEKYPLILVSHGGLRSAQDSGAWLSAILARSGYFVVEVNAPRPGSAAEAIDEIWRRPNDITRALATVLNDPNWAQYVEENRISVVGFGLGGTAALMISGGELDAQAFAQSCSILGGSPDCGWLGAQDVSLGSVNLDALTTARKDPRVSRVVAIAPEYLHAFSDRWSHADTSALIVLLGSNKDVPIRAKSTTQVVALPNTNVSDGFPVCTSAGPQILADDGSGPAICGPSAEARRTAHSSIAGSIWSFLAEPSGS